MKRFLSIPIFIILFVSLACGQSNTQPPIPTLVPDPPTETTLPTTSSESETNLTLHRGVNMGNMLEAPNEGEWGLFVEEEYFDLIKEAGLDFVRLPVRWKAHTTRTGYDDGDTGYTIEPAFFDRVDEVISWALERDLTIIIDFHHYEELMSEPNLNQFWFLWKQIAEHYKDYPPQVLFELANEPHDRMTAALWNGYIVDILKVVRESNPTRDVIIGPVNWNSADWLSTLDMPDDPHLIATFHYYSPFEFTHQGAEWNPDSGQWLGTTWDATDGEKAEITRTFDSVSEWAEQKNIRILLGEFGAYSKAPQDSRVRWTDFVAREAERHGFAWAYWEFASGFGAYDPNAKIWRDDLLKALIP